MVFKTERFVHNHPGGTTKPSKGDHEAAVALESRNSNVQLYNYTKGNNYTRYDKNTPFVVPQAIPMPTLPEIEIIFNR
jgi:hypothetical protein